MTQVPAKPRGVLVDESTAVVVRPEGWEAANEVPETWKRPGHLYRGMEDAEYQATVGAGNPIQSTGRYSATGEGTNFSTHPGDAESYINFGRSDPRKSGKPTWLVEVKHLPTIRRAPDGYWKATGPVPVSAVTRVWRFSPRGGALVAHPWRVSESLSERRAEPLPSPKVVRLFQQRYPKASLVRDYGDRVNFLFFGHKGGAPSKASMNEWLRPLGWYVGFWTPQPSITGERDLQDVLVMLAPDYGDPADLATVDKLYHVLPLGKLENVLRRGLTPTAAPEQVAGRSYEPRVYLFTDREVAKDAAVQWSRSNIHKRAAFRDDDPTIVEVDPARLPRGTKFYRDPEFSNNWSLKDKAVYTYSAIPPVAVKQMKMYGVPYHVYMSKQRERYGSRLSERRGDWLFHGTSVKDALRILKTGKMLGNPFVSFGDAPTYGGIVTLVFRKDRMESKLTQVEYTREWAEENPEYAEYVADTPFWRSNDYNDFLAMAGEREWLSRGRVLRLGPMDLDRVLVRPPKTSPARFRSRDMQRLKKAAQRSPLIEPEDVMWESRLGESILSEGKKGDCFKAAADLLMSEAGFPGKMDDDTGKVLVHAEVAGQGKLKGIRFAHAWVEDDRLVYDFSNGRRLVIPKDVYYAAGKVSTKPDKLYRYIPKETAINMVRTGHYGPWDLKTEH